MPVLEVRDWNRSNSMKPEQKVVKPEKEGQYSLDNIIGQDIERDSFLSLSRNGESPIPWRQLFHTLDQQGSNKFSNDMSVDSYVEGKGHGLDLFNCVSTFPFETNMFKESVHTLKNKGLPANGTNSTSELIKTLNISEAFVQTAAKAKGDPEKYIPGWPFLSPSKVQLQKCDKCSREFCSTINYRRHIRVHRRSLNIDKDSPKNRGLLSAFWDKLPMDDAKEILSFKNVALEEISGSSAIRALTWLVKKPVLFSLPESYVKAGMTLLEVVQARPSRLPISSAELFNALDDASEKTFLCAGKAEAIKKFVFDGETMKFALEMKNIIACISFMLEQILVKAWLTDKDVEALRCQKLLVEEEEAAHRRQAEQLERKRLKKLRQKEHRQNGSTEINRGDNNALSPEGTSDSTGTPSPRSASKPVSDQDSSFLESGDILTALTRFQLQSQIGNADQSVDRRVQMGRGQRQPNPPAARWIPANQTRNARNGSHVGLASAVKGSVLMKFGGYQSASKVWAPKAKPENKEEGTIGSVDREHNEQQVMIGSISVRLGVDNLQQKVERSANPKLYKPVSCHQGRDSTAVLSEQSKNRTSHDMPDESRGSGMVNDSCSDCLQDASAVLESGAVSGSVLVLFSSQVAEAFLAKRWKEAIASDHVVVENGEIRAAAVSGSPG